MSNNVYANQADELERGRRVAAGVECRHCDKYVCEIEILCDQFGYDRNEWLAELPDVFTGPRSE